VARIAAHARTTLVMRSWRACARWRTPHVRGSHRATDFQKLRVDELDPLRFIGPPPVVGHPRRRQSPGVAYVGVETHRPAGLRQILSLPGHGEVTGIVLGEEVP